MPFADNNGARIFWEERGSGTPILLVMGHTLSSVMWYPVVDLLAKKHRVITFDNRGTGKSSKAGKLTLSTMANDAFAVMDSAGVDAAHVYGVSMGGGIIIEMARSRPERIRSLILGCTLAKTPDVGRVPLLLRPLLVLPAPIIGAILKRIPKSTEFPPYGTAAPEEKVAHDLKVLETVGTPIQTSVAQTRAINKYSITEAEVSAFSMPALVLHGDQDASVAYEAGVKLHGMIAHSEMVTYEGAGHNFLVAYADKSADDVLDFVGRVDANASTSVA